MSTTMERIVTDAYTLAAIENNLELAKLISTKKYNGKPFKCSSRVLNIASYNGNLEFVKWLCETRPEFDPSSIEYIGVSYKAMRNAAENGHLEVVKWLHFNRPEFDINSVLYSGNTSMKIVMDNAASNDKIEVVKWLHENRTEGHSNFAINNAIRKNKLDTIMWLFEVFDFDVSRDDNLVNDIIDGCLVYDRYEIFNWFYQRYPDAVNTWSKSVDKKMYKDKKFSNNKVYYWFVNNMSEFKDVKPIEEYTNSKEVENNNNELDDELHELHQLMVKHQLKFKTLELFD